MMITTWNLGPVNIIWLQSVTWLRVVVLLVCSICNCDDSVPWYHSVWRCCEICTTLLAFLAHRNAETQMLGHPWDHQPHFLRLVQCSGMIRLHEHTLPTGTCYKNFTESVLDLLWHSQTSLPPLVGCLPTDSLCMYRKAGFPDGRDWIVSVYGLPTYNFCKICCELVPNDLDWVRYYGKGIKHILLV